MSNLIEQSFKQLFPEKNIVDYEFRLKYSDKFKPYNANVRVFKKKLQFNLSKKWKTVSKEIQTGLIQELFLKVFKEKRKSINIDLYNTFMKKIHLAVPKTKTHPILENSFNRVNEKYFHGLIEKPNLVWGLNSITKLGSYEYGSDTITISKIFLDKDSESLDYIMYHEILHKKHKFENKEGKTYHHTTKFKKSEKEFDNIHEIEERIKKLTKKQKRRSFKRFFIIK